MLVFAKGDYQIDKRKKIFTNPHSLFRTGALKESQAGPLDTSSTQLNCAKPSVDR
jgi:hypothetical protein